MNKCLKIVVLRITDLVNKIVEWSNVVTTCNCKCCLNNKLK